MRDPEPPSVESEAMQAIRAWRGDGEEEAGRVDGQIARPGAEARRVPVYS